MNASEFRKELLKIMPGYKWTVHKAYDPKIRLAATGIQSSGYNRLSTLQVTRREGSRDVEYEVRSSGYGLRSPWLHTTTDDTLASALRSLQTHYENKAQEYRSHAEYLRDARKQPLFLSHKRAKPKVRP